jgi:hypothetical protein
MAEDKIALKIEIEADRAQMSLGELEDGFDELRKKLKATNRGTEEGRKQFAELSTQMAQTSKEIKNIELGFEGLDREQVASELGSVSGAVGDITASLVLMGGENETLEQIGTSIEKAMAISMGFKGAIEGLSSANKLYNNLLKQGKVAVIAKSIAEKAAAAGTWILNAANKALNTTLKMNPIGLIVIAITAVVGAIVYFKDAIMDVMEVALKPFQWAIDAVVDALQWLGIMESDSAIATREAEAAKEKATREAVNSRIKELKKLEDANRLLTDNLVADKDFEIAKLKAAGKDTTELERAKLVMLEKSYIEQKKLQLKRLKLIDEEVERLGFFKAGGEGKLTEQRELNEAIVKTEADLLETSQALEIFDIEVKTKNSIKRTKIKTEEAKETEKINAKEIEDQKKKDEKLVALEKDRIKLLEDLEAKAIDDKNVRALAELENTQARERAALIEKFGQDTELLLALTTEQELAMVTLIADIEQEAREKKAALDKEARDKELEDNQIALDKKREQSEKDFESAKQLIGAIGSLNSAALANDLKNAGDNEALKEKLRKASFEREKKLNIAMALINGAQAQMAILAQTPKADFGVATVIAMVAAAATTIGQIAAIKSTSYQGGGSPAVSESASVSAGGAGSAGGGAQISPVSNTSTILGDQQVYVTETDITDTQNNVSVIEESATF